jgi:hypothetical protein
VELDPRPNCELPKTEDGGGPTGVNDKWCDDGGGPAGVVEGLDEKLRRLSGVAGGLEEIGTAKPDIATDDWDAAEEPPCV